MKWPVQCFSLTNVYIPNVSWSNIFFYYIVYKGSDPLWKTGGLWFVTNDALLSHIYYVTLKLLMVFKWMCIVHNWVALCFRIS